MLSSTLVGCVALILVLLRGAETQKLTMLGRQFDKCELDRLQRNYFHAVTCFGFVRVSFKYQTYESFNAKVDGILEEAKKKREAAGKDVNCSTYSVTPLYYSATELLFVRYPKVHEGDKLQEDQRDVSYWIANVTEMTDQFVNFPERQHWFLIGKGYWLDKFNMLSYDEKEKSICDPQHVKYNMKDKKIEFTEGDYSTSMHLESKKYEGKLGCMTGRRNLYKRYDPTLLNTKHYRKYSGITTDQDVLDRDVYFCTEQYGGNAFISTRERIESDQYYFLFGEVDQPSRDSWLAGKSELYQIANSCYLRKFRHDLGELNVPYILPQDAKTRIITDGDEFVTTTTIPTTTVATTASTTTKPPTTTQRRETAKVEEKTTANEADEREYTDPPEEENMAQPSVEMHANEALNASSLVRIGMIAFLFVFAVDILL